MVDPITLNILSWTWKEKTLAVVSHLFWTEYLVEILNGRKDKNQNDRNCKQLGFLKIAEPLSIFTTFCTDPISDG